MSNVLSGNNGRPGPFRPREFDVIFIRLIGALLLRVYAKIQIFTGGFAYACCSYAGRRHGRPRLRRRSPKRNNRVPEPKKRPSAHSHHVYTYPRFSGLGNISAIIAPSRRRFRTNRLQPRCPSVTFIAFRILKTIYEVRQ